MWQVYPKKPKNLPPTVQTQSTARKKKAVPRSFMLGCSAVSSALCSWAGSALTLRQALITPWKKVCGDCAWSLPIPAYFGDFDKEQEETQHTPSGSSVQRRFIVSVLTGTPFLWQWTMFLLIHYFVLLQSWGQEGFWTEANLSLRYIIHHQLSYWSSGYF